MFLAVSEEAFKDVFFAFSDDKRHVEDCEFKDDISDNIIDCENFRMFGANNGESGN